MKYQKSTGVSGKWVDKAKLMSDDIKVAKIVSETAPQPSSFSDKNGNPQTQDVAKVQFNGWDEVVNVSLNKPTIAALIDAFGDESAEWQGHELGVVTEKVKIAGKSSIALYLVPEGFKVMDDDEGYTVIVSGDEVDGDEPESKIPF